MVRPLRILLFGGLLAVGVLLVSCSSSNSSSSSTASTATASATAASTATATATATSAPATATATPTAAPATATPTAAAGGSATTTLDVTLNEWSVKAAQASVPAGTVDFKVKNAGTVGHELVVIKTDLAPDKLPVKGSAVDTTKVDVIGTLTQFGAGQTKDLSLKLTPGKYVLICNLPGHYQLGMHTGLTVR